MSVLIRGGRIITAADDYLGDVFIEGEVVSLLGKSLDVDADRNIDASGKYVIPGGVDPHTHIDLDYGGLVSCDDFTTATIAAAFGGTTTVVDFCCQFPGQTFAEAVEAWQGKLDRHPPVIDVGFHLIVTDLKGSGSLDALARMPEQGITSYKLFMAYKGSVMIDDDMLFKTMLVAKDSGALVMVHAENGDVIDELVKQALAEGKTEPKWHAATRPTIAEGEATNRAIRLAHMAEAPLYVVHMSCKEAIDPLARAQARGWRVWGETCPHYLFVDESYLERPGFEGAKYVYTPPPRPKEEQEVLWNAIINRVVSVVASDHCAYRWEDQKARGKDDFSKIPNGGPGIENRIDMLYAGGVSAGRISMNRLVELTSTTPAKLFGMYPRKGTIAVGSDADIVVFDPNRERKISASTHHSRSDYNLYEGAQVPGGAQTVLVRGEVVVEDGELVGEPTRGRFVRRAAFGERLNGASSEVGTAR